MHIVRLVPVVALLTGSLTHAEGIQVQILDATIKDKVVAGAEVILQKNGEASVTARSGADGTVALPAKPGSTDDASMTLIAKKEGYSSLVVRCPCGGLTYALSPVISTLDGMRIVLDWGATPRDLDSHLVYEDQHVYFSSRNGRDSNLDVDDTDGFGPETITVMKKHPGVRYVYAVHDYTHGDQHGSGALSQTSQAQVFVYVGSSLVRTFRPPAAKPGNVWVVFAIGEDGEFYDINTFHDISSRDKVGEPLAQIVKGGQLVSKPVLLANGSDSANALNKEGERRYHAKQLDEAVRLYLQAIDANPEHAQAYSNLGLAYQKLGNRAEAIWANRKAIALASGATAATVKASSYYNIARVYEEQGEWQSALDSFQQALASKQNEAYTKGIARMNAKLGK
jgi:uncharacterized protein YfaP (DUF2135 family)